MHQLTSEQPIGIFDSGVGGLTIAKELVKFLPNENIVYFGDTAHFPYGERSAAAIQAYSIKIVNMLLQQHCKLILIACNTASAAAYELIKEYIGDKALVIDVINPTVNLLKQHYINKRIGLIGTKHTVSSNLYKKKIDDAQANIQLQSHATPLLAQTIEEGLGNTPVVDCLLDIYLNHPSLQDIDALILACTHYPIIKDKIQNFYKQPITIIDNAAVVTKAVEKELALHKLLNSHGSGDKRFYISDYTEAFAASSRLFFDDSICLEHYPLWD